MIEMNAVNAIHHFINVLYHDNVLACDDGYLSDPDLKNFDPNPAEYNNLPHIGLSHHSKILLSKQALHV